MGSRHSQSTDGMSCKKSTVPTARNSWLKWWILKKWFSTTRQLKLGLVNAKLTLRIQTTILWWSTRRLTQWAAWYSQETFIPRQTKPPFALYFQRRSVQFLEGINCPMTAWTTSTSTRALNRCVRLLYSMCVYVRERERERVVHHQPFFLFFSQCHLRLRSPRHTQVLVDHFSSYPKVQSRGLDGVGTTPDNIDQAIKMEIVHGKREEVYWEKVPEGVRQQAVRRALTQTMDDVPEPESVASRKGARQRRKRET